MLITTLSHPEKELIRMVCDRQLQSLMRTSFQRSALFKLIESGIDEDEAQIKKAIASLIKTFSRIRNNPEDFLDLDPPSHSLMVHNLFNWDDDDFKYTHDPRPRLYGLLFNAERFRNHVISLN